MRVRRALETTRVDEVMTTGVIDCPRDTSLSEVAALMAEHRVHAVYVIEDDERADESGRLWGVVSDLDLVAAAYGPLDERTAGDSAVTPMISIASDETVFRAAQRMIENQVSHLAVVDPATWQQVGVLSTLDVARLVATAPAP